MKLENMPVSLYAASLANQALGQGQCDSTEPETEAIRATHDMRTAQPAEQSTGKRSSLSCRAEGLRISTYLHVVESEDKAGFVTGKMLEGQVSSTP